MLQELRIGNLVSYQNEVYEIKSLGSHEANLGDGKGTHPYGSISGIALTEEWLLKLGFTKGQTDDTDRLTVFSIQISNVSALYISLTEEVLPFISYDWKSSFGHEFWKKPKFVHEVQNLYFALTGEELTIKS